MRAPTAINNATHSYSERSCLAKRERRLLAEALSRTLVA